ncbi:hypothetical protein GCM10027184_51940 [Saccharothrix stipae]
MFGGEAFGAVLGVGEGVEVALVGTVGERDTEHAHQAEAMAELVRLRVEQGEVDCAESLTQSIADPAYTARVLAGLDCLVDPGKITALMIELTVRDHWSTLIPLAALPDRTSLLEILSDEVTAALR